MRLSTAGMHRTSIDAILEHQAQAGEDAEPGHHRQEIPDRGRGSDRRRARARRSIARSRTTRSTRAIRTSSRAASTTKNRRWPTSPRCCSRCATARCRARTPRSATTERKMLANDVRQNSRRLLDIANRTRRQRRVPVRRHVDRTRGRSRRAPAGVNYQGDSTTAQIRISSTQSLADVHTGADAFMGIAETQRRVPHEVSARQYRQCDHRRGPRDGSHRLGARQLHAAVHQRHRLAGGRRHAADAGRHRDGHGIHLGAEHQLSAA